MSEQTYVPVNFKHSGSTSVEPALHSALYSSRLDPQVRWTSRLPVDPDFIAVDVSVWCFHSYLVLPRVQQGLQYLLPLNCDPVMAVCERWWDLRTAYPLLSSSEFQLVVPLARPAAELRETVEQASFRIKQPVLRVRPTQLQRISQARGKYFACLCTVLLLWLVFLLLDSLYSTTVIGPVCAGAGVFILLLSTLLAGLSLRARHCYREVAVLLREFCAQQSTQGYKIRAIGAFALVVERDEEVP